MTGWKYLSLSSCINLLVLFFILCCIKCNINFVALWTEAVVLFYWTLWVGPFSYLGLKKTQREWMFKYIKKMFKYNEKYWNKIYKRITFKAKKVITSHIWCRDQFCKCIWNFGFCLKNIGTLHFGAVNFQNCIFEFRIFFSLLK